MGTEHCAACGMPLTTADTRLRTGKGPICGYCVGPDGKVRSCTEVFEGTVGFFLRSVPGVSRALAERVARRNLRSQPYWRERDEPVLDGARATRAEFDAVLAALHKAQRAEGNA